MKYLIILIMLISCGNNTEMKKEEERIIKFEGIGKIIVQYENKRYNKNNVIIINTSKDIEFSVFNKNQVLKIFSNTSLIKTLYSENGVIHGDYKYNYLKNSVEKK